MKYKIEKGDSSGTIYQQIIRNRKYDDCHLNCNIDNLADMYLMKDLEKAADRIIKAIRNKEKIIIFGHDDLDGITATYLLFDFFENAGSQSHYYYIPNRLLENHGLQRNFIDKVKNGKFDLVVTVDGGVSCVEAVDEIKSFGCDVIITDHHLVPEILPNADAIVNSKQKDCKFPYDMLAGVGVSWYLCKMMAEKLDIELKKEYLFWTAVGTIADKAPLDGLNRIIVKEILENWHEYENNVMMALSGYIWSGSNFSSRMAIIRYLIKLLANGRDSNGKHKALYFMLNPLREKSITLKVLIDEMHKWEDKIKGVQKFIRMNAPAKGSFGFLFYDNHDKILLESMGICASIISKENMIPTLFLKKKNDVIVCEARCTNGFNLIELFTYCKNDLIQFGGHVKAAGFTMEEKNIKIFTKHFYDYCEAHQEEITSEWKYSVDAIFQADDIDAFERFIKNDYNQLLPFGQGNPELIYLMKNFNPMRNHKKFKMKEMIFDEDSKYDVIYKINGSGILVLDFLKVN